MPNIIIPGQYLTNLTRKEQILELNTEVKCVLKPSSIQGIGVFALKNIRKGERCFIMPRIEPRFYNLSFSNFNQLLPEVKELILARWASVVNGSVFRSPNDDASLLMFVNHSSDNYNYDVISDTALRNICTGEEILEDYRAMKNWQLAYPDLEKWRDASTNNVLKKQENLNAVQVVKQHILNWLKN